MRERSQESEVRRQKAERAERAMVLSAECRGQVRACALTKERLAALDYNADLLARRRGDLDLDAFAERWG